MLKSKDTEARVPRNSVYFFPAGEMFRLIKTIPSHSSFSFFFFLPSFQSPSLS